MRHTSIWIKFWKDAIALGNKLTFQQIYDLAKTEESATAQMKAITQGNSEIKIKETHSVPSSNTGFQDHRVPKNPRDATGIPTIPKSIKTSSSITVDVLDVEAITKGKHHAQLSTQHADFAEKKDISSRHA